MNENLFGNPEKDKIVWKISGKWARKKVDCSLHGITTGCFGCCKKRQGWTPARVYPMRLYDDLTCGHFIENKGCEYDIKERPLGCLMYPWELNDNGMLVLYGNAIITSCKRTYNTQEKTIFEHFKNTWIEIFSEEQYSRVYNDLIVKELDRSFFEPSAKILNIYKEEMFRVEKNLKPVSRKESKTSK